MKETDIIIVGAGIIGLNIALELRNIYPKRTITIIDKENNSISHGSGRNSGVLHAGFYYSNDSLKAKFTREGNELLTKFCEDNKLNIRKSGKLVVAANEAELKTLLELKKRAEHNKIPIELISSDEAKDIEPNVITYNKALWSPITSAINPVEVVAKFTEICQKQNINIIYDCKYLSNIDNHAVQTSKGNIKYKYLVNSAGLYADNIAKDYGLSKNYKIIPFKGIYLYADQSPLQPKTQIYPVPDLKFPFLGVHYTITTDGRAKIGPTSIPAFWRENYNGFKNFNLSEMTNILFQEAKLFTNNHFNFRKLAIREVKKYYKPYLVKEAAQMFSVTDKLKFSSWGKPGIRAQLYNIKDKKLEMDFKYEKTVNSLHILNAVSPAFTCSMSLAKYIVKNELTNLNES